MLSDTKQAASPPTPSAEVQAASFVSGSGKGKVMGRIVEETTVTIRRVRYVEPGDEPIETTGVEAPTVAAEPTPDARRLGESIRGLKSTAGAMAIALFGEVA